jgi:hemoglobin
MRMKLPSAGETMGDLDSRTQIYNLVVRFYREVVFDDLLGPVFTEVAEVDWSAHIPKLIDYWCRVLLGQPGYDGSILAPHQLVHDLQAFRAELFDRWYLLFCGTVDEAWRGPIAERAKIHAARIATVLARRLLDIEWVAPTLSRTTDRDELRNDHSRRVTPRRRPVAGTR